MDSNIFLMNFATFKVSPLTLGPLSYYIIAFGEYKKTPTPFAKNNISANLILPNLES